ncbi:hypothetical protein [Streptomyces sp. NPDC051364]|uniref:hypothetical protein n=1 Tax=Streptomyces sp. NPDC051364 TaxID=3155799 RepID=UPI003438131D
MTLLTPDHVPAVDELIRLRMYWLLDRRLPLSGESSNLVDLVRLPEPEPGMLPVGMWDGETLVAALAVQAATPMAGWTLEERQESSLAVSLAHTHPEQQGLGRLLTHWLCDYAARRPSPPAWIRCTVRVKNLADYLEHACGWEKVREITGWKGDSHLFQRAPQRDRHMRLLVRGEGELA